MALIKCCFSEPIEIEIPDFLVQKCTNQSCCCGCCSALRPKYKSLVDNIFPANPEDGLVKSNMEKLTFYSLRSPEKLDRIGEYLYQKASKDINRKRYKLVEIAMEAMDQLLMACHAHSLNLFVESFLRMVQKLLEDANPNLQIMATSSFVKFANIEEDTPSYHRRYDFFISKFSSMCHSSYDDMDINNSIRMAGIKGLQGVIRKTVSDDLVENIWDKQHMEKIVPSLLYNMQTGSQETIQEEHQSTPPLLAEAVLRELVSRASFGHIKAVLKPLLKHLDNHELWVPHKFAIHTFRIVMLSIQPQYSYTVVETLMTHLDANQSSSPKTKTSLAVVLSKIISIAAGESVGPSALDIINNLLTHVRTSVGTKHSLTGEETQYQDALINALGEFANHHPDYQKIEIMLFIMNTVPDLSKRNKEDILLQNILLKCLLKVGVQYRTVSFEKAFPASFMHPLLKMARSPQIPTRITVMQILQQLLDRHQNQDILNMVSIKNYATLSLETPSRSDILFTHKHGANMMQALIEAMSMDDNIEALVSVYNTAALMVCEMVCTETISEFLLYVLGVQQVSIAASEMTPEHRANLHCVAISLLALLGRCTGITSIIDYTEKVIESRKEDALYLLPPLNAADSQNTINLEVPHLMLDKLALVECLQSAGIDHIRLQAATPYSLVQYDPGHRQSWVDTGMTRASVTDIGSNDIDSVSSSPGVQRKPLVMELNFESMKRVLTEPITDQKEKKKEKQKETVRTFREFNFDDLVKHTETKHDMIQNKLNELFNSLTTSYGNPVDGYLSPTTKQNQQKKVYENHFPELFFY